MRKFIAKGPVVVSDLESMVLLHNYTTEALFNRLESLKRAKSDIYGKLFIMQLATIALGLTLSKMAQKMTTLQEQVDILSGKESAEKATE